MKPGGAERRRGRRVPLQASLLLQRPGEPAPRKHTIQNISLAGAYFETDQPSGLSLHDEVVASVSIPAAERRTFPFARLAGRSRVVRVEELPAASGRDAKRYGVALEFSPDATALTAIPTAG